MNTNLGISKAKLITFLLLPFLFFVSLTSKTWGAIYYVDQNNPIASDNNPGTALAPFLTAQRGIETTLSGDTVYIHAGEYDLDGWSKHLEQNISLIGENKETTVLKNGKRFFITTSMNISNLGFTQFTKPVFYLTGGDTNSINTLTFSNCRFFNTPFGIYSLDALRAISNVSINNCVFSEMRGPTVTGIRISHGKISDINIDNNTFTDLTALEGSCFAIVVGSNATRHSTRAIRIQNNSIDAITGPATDGIEVKAIAAYGADIKLIENRVSNLNSGQDHEAIYLKASYSQILRNTVTECGSGPGGADICVKGGESCRNNTISENHISSSKEGRGILADGEAIIESNYIRKTNISPAVSYPGIEVYCYGKKVYLHHNSVESQMRCISVFDAVGGEISNNYLTSYVENPVSLENCASVKMKNNIINQGYGLPPIPLPKTFPKRPKNLRIIKR